MNPKATCSWLLALALGALVGCFQEMPPSPTVDAPVAVQDGGGGFADAAASDVDAAQASPDAGGPPDGGCPVLDGGVDGGDRDGGCPLPDAGMFDAAATDAPTTDASAADGMI